MGTILDFGIIVEGPRWFDQRIYWPNLEPALRIPFVEAYVEMKSRMGCRSTCRVKLRKSPNRQNHSGGDRTPKKQK